MALTKIQKQKIIEDLKEKASKQKAMVFADFTGLKVKDLSNLRKELRASENELKVVKKTLLGLALKEKKIELEEEKLKGEIAVIFGFKDELSPAKMIYQFSQGNPNLKILGSFFENKFQNAEETIVLAKLPTRNELLSGLVSTISAPMSQFVNVLQGNIKGLICVLAKAKI